MGGAPTAFALRMRAARAAGKPFDIVEHCHGLGRGGVQTNPPSTDAEAIRKFRERLEAYKMHLICDPRLPRQESDVPGVEGPGEGIQGGRCPGLSRCDDRPPLRGISIHSEPFKKMYEQCRKSVELAEPVLRRHRVRLGIENHKGWRSAEQAAWLRRLVANGSASAWIWADRSLCEDPMDTLRSLLPHTFFTHIKDMAVEEYEDGFLLSEVPMGEGILDLKQMVRLLRQKDPNMPFELEMITRDPLKIPVFTTKYWATFDDSYSPLPGRDLAKVLALVRKNHPKQPLPRMTGLSPEAQVKSEDEYNLKCVEYARQNLEM